MIYTLENVQQDYIAGKKIKYLFFWGHTPKAADRVDQSCFSQWWSSAFTIEGVTYSCTEQYMMAEKARLFDDQEMLNKIMEAKHPKQMKMFGRSVQHFDNELWQAHSYEIVKRGNLAKFQQNEQLGQFLCNTGKRVLVEASPQDKIWGIGLAQDHPDAERPIRWKGTNWLGFALMEVRDVLNAESYTQST
jgi:ribA/ribD-fused uncharacterized protein